MKNKKQALSKSFYHAFKGIGEVLPKERNLKIHLSIMTLVIISGIIFKISMIEWLICIILFGIVISLELVNTAIEKTVDICMPEINEQARIAKDVSAGAVLIGAITAAIVGLIIFIPKGINFIQTIL